MKYNINIKVDHDEDLEKVTEDEIKEGLECYFAQCNIYVAVEAKQIMEDKDIIKHSEDIIKSLKWVLFNLGDTKPNTFENDIKVYIESVIKFIDVIIK